ncbi:MAG: site-specific DNA-methyltransferase [bacterium]|nr:site-specific DNA-methyltransferase [bacterium]
MQKNKEVITDSKSLDIRKKKIEELKKIFPEIFTESNEIDIDKLKQTLGESVDTNKERYVLNWAGKNDSFKVLQTTTSATLAPDKGESVNFDTIENIFIEGENLEVLKVLQKSYFGKIKMIYIDPPYNTGNDSFIYPDKFSETKDEYFKRIGEKDEEGFMLKEGFFRKNSKENGQYHSNWLSMMYPRLFLARNLLRDDGVIFVSIDDNEVHNLRMIMNEIFGEENFLGEIVWQKKYGPANDAKHLSSTHEYVIGYTRKMEDWQTGLFQRDEIQLLAFKNPDNDPRGLWRASDLSARTYSSKTDYPIKLPSEKIVNPPPSRSWIVTEKKYQELIDDNRIWFGIDGKSRPMQKKFLTEIRDGITPQTWWDRDFADDNKVARYELKDLFPENIFETPKPKKLIKRLLEISISKDALVLDFFAGSGTTAHAVLELNKEDGGNRKFILVQLPEKTAEDSEAYKAGYKTIADICKERIRRVIKNLESDVKNEQLKLDKEENEKLDLGFKVFKLKHSNFKLWRSDVIETGDDLEKQLDAFEDPIKSGAEELNIVYELLLKLGYDLNVKLEHQMIFIKGTGEYVNGVYSDSVSGNFEWWEVDSGKLIIVTDADMPVTNLLNHLKKDKKIKPEKVICLDKIFNGNDEAKTNLVLQMKDAGVEFKTV